MSHAEEPRRVAVIGGGITGLAAAYALACARRAGARTEEFLIEASERVGGLIRTELVEGFVVEGGPDSFVADKPEAASLCRKLGLGDSLLGSNDRERRTYILRQGRLVPLPDGLELFVPTRLLPVLRTPLLPLRSKLTLASQWLARSPDSRRRSPPFRSDDLPETADESVASFVLRHFGDGVLDNIADPLLAGIFGGDSAALSFRSTLPRLQELESRYGSLMRGVREARKQRQAAADPKLTPATKPLFLTLKGGLEQMVTALRNSLDPFRLFLGRGVIAIERPSVGRADAIPSPARRYRIRCAGDVFHQADAIILALPAHESSRLVSPLSSKLSKALQGIPYTSALTVSLGYDEGLRERLPSGFGFLVPKKEGRRMLACTFVHNKFSHRAPLGKALLRCFLAGSRDPEVMGLGDEEIISILLAELRGILNLSERPLFHRIHRWPSSMPQYAVGHAERLKVMETELENCEGLYLAGNAYSGVGLSDCVRTAEAAAARAIEARAQRGQNRSA